MLQTEAQGVAFLTSVLAPLAMENNDFRQYLAQEFAAAPTVPQRSFLATCTALEQGQPVPLEVISRNVHVICKHPTLLRLWHDGAADRARRLADQMVPHPARASNFRDFCMGQNIEGQLQVVQWWHLVCSH